jgi:hypothetical protein
MNDAVASAIFEESRRLLARQETDLDTLRARALSMVSAATVAAGLFTVRLPPQRSALATAALFVALGAYVATVLAALRITWPTRFAFSHKLDKWVDDLREGRDPNLTEWAYTLSRDFESFRKKNHSKIKPFYNWLSAICVLLAIQVAAWLMAVTL